MTGEQRDESYDSRLDDLISLEKRRLRNSQNGLLVFVLLCKVWKLAIYTHGHSYER